MKKSYSFILLLFFISSIIFFQSCSKDDNPVKPTEENDVIIPKTTKSIDSTDYTSNLISISNDSLTFTFKSEFTTKYNLAVNDVLVIAKGSGLLRKITNIQSFSNETIITTRQATLTEAIEKGIISLRQSLQKVQISKVDYYYQGIKYKVNKGQESNYDFNLDIVLYDLDDNQNTTNDQVKLVGNFTLNADVVFEANIDNLQLQNAKIGLEATNSESLQLMANLNYNIEKEFTLATIHYSPIYFQLGPLPVIILIQLDIKAGGNGYANASLTMGVENTVSYGAGINYVKNQGWGPYSEYNNEFNYTPPTLTADAGSKVYVKPEISLSVYGVLAGYANAEAYGEILVDFLNNPWWELYTGLNFGVGARAGIWGVEVFDYETNVLELKWLVAQASHNSGTTLYSENFDSRTVGALPPDWIEIHSGDGSSQVTSNYNYTPPNSFSIGCLSSWDGRYDRLVSLSFSDSLVFEYKFYGDPNTWFRPMAGIRIGDKLLFMAFNTNTGKIQWVDGSTTIETATITKGIWYSVKMVYNKLSNKANYYLNGHLEGYNLSPGTPPSNSQGEGIILSSGNGGNGIIYFDDLNIIAY